MFSRAGRASLLDRKAFTEAFFDGDAPADAAILVSIVAAVGYVGTLLWLGVLGAFSIANLFQIVLGGVVSWLVLGFATWFVANRLFGASSRPQTLMGIQGLAVLPLILEVFGSIAGGIGLVWYLVILVVGTREATDLSMRNAAVSVLIGFAVAVLIRALLGVPFAVLSALF